ncbi:hypothetical protein NHJ13734_004343 [Beauveria thailandica]
MSIEFGLIEDTLSANIPADEAFLQFEVSKIHADGFTLGLSMDEDNPDTSKNHWAIILETRGKNIRLSMESRENNKTGEPGVLVLKSLGYLGMSENVIHRETYSMKDPTVMVQDILELVFAVGWHKYKMFTTIEGAKKGCRHHVKTMLAGFQSQNWIDSRSDTGNTVDDFLSFVYTKDEDQPEMISVKPKPIDLGKFL